MFENGWPALAIIVFVLAWMVSKVFHCMKKSEQQWRDVDKTKLKKWQDDAWDQEKD